MFIDERTSKSSCSAIYRSVQAPAAPACRAQKCSALQQARSSLDELPHTHGKARSSAQRAHLHTNRVLKTIDEAVATRRDVAPSQSPPPRPLSRSRQASKGGLRGSSQFALIQGVGLQPTQEK